MMLGRDVRWAIAAALAALLILAFCAIANATEATVGVDPPTDGTRVLLTCNSIGSVELTTPNPPPYTMQTRWATVRGSQRAEPCPVTQEHDNVFAFTTEPRRNYIVSVRVRVYAADGSLISDRYPAPYYYFENGLAKPAAPVMHRTLSASRGPTSPDRRLHGRVMAADSTTRRLLPWELSDEWGFRNDGGRVEFRRACP